MAAIESAPHLHPIHIPDDILRLILEELFNLPGITGSGKLDLIVLSSHVRPWLQPLLYRHLDMSRWPRDVSAILEVAARRDMFTHTRSIFTRRAEHIDSIPTVLAVCSNTVQLACWFSESLKRWGETLGMTHQSLHLLSISIECLENTFEIDQPLFRSLTHLDLELAWDVEPEPEMSMLQGLRSLTNLLYFGLHVLYDDEIVHSGQSATLVAEAIASELPPTLRLALLWQDGDDIDIDYRWLVEKCDPRIAFYVGWDKRQVAPFSAESLDLVLLRTDSTLDWNPGMHPDVWERAEKTLERRRVLKSQ